MIPIRLGFMPLVDAAIPIVAVKRGFAAAQGLAVTLTRDTSWANIRDRLAIGDLDAAHLLAPLPLASALGLTPLNAPLIAPMALGLGGNAVTVSQALWQQMQTQAPEARPGDAASMGAALRRVVTQRHNAGLPRLGLAVVHDFSAHNYELRYWLHACGIAPDMDIDICVISPSLMPGALAAGRIDGFCVGEPWNSIAQINAGGMILLTKSQIWRASPEKVLSVRQDWAESNPAVLNALLVSCLQAAAWAGAPENTEALADVLSAPDALDMPREYILPSLYNGLAMPDGTRSRRSDGVIFFEGAATFPWRDHALWFLHAMAKWEGLVLSHQDLAAAAAIYQPDLYRRAAACIGLNAPSVDEKPAGAGPVLTVAGTSGPLAVPASTFFDQ